MKKIVLIVTVIFVTITAGAQSRFDGFWKPVSIHPHFVGDITVDEVLRADRGSLWLYRPTVSVTALAIEKIDGQFQTSSFTKLGAGISYSRFKEIDGKPYSDISINALILMNTLGTETTLTSLNLALTISALQFINMGVGFSLGDKRIFFLTGIAYSFN